MPIFFFKIVFTVVESTETMRLFLFVYLNLLIFLFLPKKNVKKNTYTELRSST